MEMKWKVIGLLVVVYVVYLLIGAAIFIAIEKPRELQACQDTLAALESFRTNLTATGNNAFTADGFKNLLQVVNEASNNGVVFDSDYNPTCASNWEFNKAFLFAGTIVTTIGYGHISPQTRGGQTFCIFYAMFGIPLFGVLMLGLGGKCAKVVKKIEQRIKTKINSDRMRRWLLILVTTALTIVFFSVIPAVIFSVIEKWDYREAYYFTIVTLTTVGFGDFVAGQNPDISYGVVYRIMIFFWIILGLACMATVISQLTDKVQEAGAQIGDRIEPPLQEDVETSSNEILSKEQVRSNETKSVES